MENNKQSSVEWFAEKLKSQGLLIGEPDNLVAFQQAKAMHKQEIMDAYNAASGGDSWYNGKEFYNKEYGKDNADNTAV